MTSVDPTRIDLEHGEVDPWTDPFHRYISGVAYHGNTPFEVPFISHIEGNLYQGGTTTGLVLPERFRHLFTMYPWETYTIRDGHDVQVHEHAMYDSEDGADRDQVVEIAERVVEAMADGPTLVVCQAGLNRSGLIAGAALVLQGWEPQEAVALLRSQRSPAVLCNKSFEALLFSLAANT